MQETWVQSLGQKDPLEKDLAPHSSILAWRIPWTEELGGLQSMGSQRVGHDWATFNFTRESCRLSGRRPSSSDHFVGCNNSKFSLRSELCLPAWRGGWGEPWEASPSPGAHSELTCLFLRAWWLHLQFRQKGRYLLLHQNPLPRWKRGFSYHLRHSLPRNLKISLPHFPCSSGQDFSSVPVQKKKKKKTVLEDADSEENPAEEWEQS